MHEWLRRGSMTRRFVRVLTLLVVMAVVIPGTAFAVVLGAYLFLPLPTALPEEEAQVASQISTVYAADGSPIGQFREAFQAIPIEADEIPDTVRRAVIAAEDHDFFAHDGVDFGAVARALVANVTRGRIVQGGSTITQQLVKNLYFDEEERTDRSPIRKAQEAILAAQLERELSKEEILAKYLNTVYMGDSAFGVEAASRSYFRKPARELDLSEAALLAQTIPAPSLFSPRSNPSGAEERRLRVLDQMRDHGLASDEEVEAARARKPVIHPPPGVEGKHPWFLDYVWAYLTRVRGYPEETILRGGLRIETTLDPELQQHAESVVASTLDAEGDPQAALVAVEPTTGFVQALVGGRDRSLSQTNNALGPLRGPTAATGRQAGSSFKVFVLARALEAGLSPSKSYPAPSCVNLPGGYSPCNYGNSGYGSATIRRATHASINTVFTQLILDVGVQETAKLARRMGITTIDPENPDYGAALALGTGEVTPLDMAAAFGVFAARGMRHEPTPILRLVTREGEVLEDGTQREPRRVLREPVADTVNDILRGVITSGTARSANIGRPAAGKTGTEDDNSDAWFVGYTPNLSTAVWMGHEAGQIPMRNVHGVGAVTGGSLPASMWKQFMTEALEGVEKTDFKDPAPLDSLRERSLRDQRGGFDLGARRWGPGLPGGDFYEDPPTPTAGTPPPIKPTTTTSSTSSTTTSSTTSSTSTTTTTEPEGPGPL